VAERSEKSALHYSPCTLGQQVNTQHPLIVLYRLVSLLFGIASSYAIVQTAYCLVASIVSPSCYCDYLHLLLSSINSV